MIPTRDTLEEIERWKVNEWKKRYTMQKRKH